MEKIYDRGKFSYFSFTLAKIFLISFTFPIINLNKQHLKWQAWRESALKNVEILNELQTITVMHYVDLMMLN
jgi:hypothetical protein